MKSKKQNHIRRLIKRLRATVELKVNNTIQEEQERYNDTASLYYLGVEATPQLIYTLQHDPSDRVRGCAAEILGMLRSNEAIPVLIKQAKNARGDTREFSVRALYEMPDSRAIDALISALADPNWEIAMWAASALGKIESEKAVPALLVALDDERDTVRAVAAWALAQIGQPDTISKVAKLLDDNEKSPAISAPVSYFAAQALEKFGTPEALQALKEWKANEAQHG